MAARNRDRGERMQDTNETGYNQTTTIQDRMHTSELTLHESKKPGAVLLEKLFSDLLSMIQNDLSR